MQRRSFFFIRLMGIAVVVALPLVLLNAHAMYLAHQSAKASAFSLLRGESRRAAKEVAVTVDGAERTLDFVIGNEAVRSLSQARCTEFLQGLNVVEPKQAVGCSRAGRPDDLQFVP